MEEYVAPRADERRLELPHYPILDPLELGDDPPDRRAELPDVVQRQLAPEDTVIEIITPEIAERTLQPSAIREIMRIIEGGVPVASLAGSENAGVESLRKFETPHGRDALEIARKLHHKFPSTLRDTLLLLAQKQGVEDEMYADGLPFRQEERGRIMLLDRDPNDPIGRKFSEKLRWGFPFYGSIDATPTFISAIHAYTTHHDPDFLRTSYIARDGQQYNMAHALNDATDWLIGKLNETPEGFIEFRNAAARGGMDAQAWKDSAFAYVHRDGSRANHRNGIASVEVQALAYDALMDSAELSRMQGDLAFANILDDRAKMLGQRFFESFWIDDPKKGGYFALGLDRDPSNRLAHDPLRVRTSNMGHLLQSRLLEADDPTIRHMRDEVVRQLFTPEMLAPSGIRTLACDEAAFRPGGYHTGSVWLWDTARIADGLERHGFHHLAWNLRERIWRTVQETKSFPEFVRGESTNNVEINPSEIYVWNQEYKTLHLFEQPPQEIQGWSVSAILAAKYAYSEYLRNRDSLPTSPLEQSILGRIST